MLSSWLCVYALLSSLSSASLPCMFSNGLLKCDRPSLVNHGLSVCLSLAAAFAMNIWNKLCLIINIVHLLCDHIAV